MPLLAFVTALVLTGVVRSWAVHTELMDSPNARSSHTVATPRGGGLAILAATLLALALLTNSGQLELRVAVGLAGGGLAVGLTGLADDRWSLSAGVRLWVHFLAVLWCAVWGLQDSGLLALGIAGLPAPLAAAVLLLAAVWALNLFNFMDGIDGLAGSQAVFMGVVGWALLRAADPTEGLAVLMLSIAGASAGFLLWNLSPRRIFLGDVGSGFLGLVLGVVPLLASATSGVPLATWAIVWGAFLCDASVTLVRRMLAGQKWREPHRTHAYQLLAIHWSSHGRVTLIWTLVNVLWLLPLAFWSAHRPEVALPIAILALMPLALAAWFVGAAFAPVPGDPAGG